MNCKYCQAPLEEESAVCPACGKAQEELIPEETPEMPAEEMEIAEETPLAEETEVSEECEASDEATKPASKKKAWLKITAAVLCVVLLFGLGAGIWYGVNGGFAPRANDLHAKDVYAVEVTV